MTIRNLLPVLYFLRRPHLFNPPNSSSNRCVEREFLMMPLVALEHKLQWLLFQASRDLTHPWTSQDFFSSCSVFALSVAMLIGWVVTIIP